LATADQVFSHDLVLAFLASLRRCGKEKFDARYASTPQIHAYVEGCRRELAADSTPARWHYLYSLTRSQDARVQLLSENDLQWFGIALGRVANIQLHFNQLLVHATLQAYALEGPIPVAATSPLQGLILLHGYLW
jgi:hypothetical protein